MEDKLYFYKATLTRVVDGDTIEAMVDLGFHTWRDVTIRLLDVDTPEIRTRDAAEKARGLAVKTWLENLFAGVERKFYLYSKSLDSFGRSLGYIYIDGQDKTVNQMLLDEGLAERF